MTALDRGLDRFSPYLLLSSISFFWALNWIVGRILRDDVPAYSISFWRWFLCALMLLPFAWPHLRRDWPKLRRSWRIMVVFGVTGTTFISVLTYTGLRYTTAINGSILNSFTPIFIIATSWAFFGMRLDVSQWFGVFISLLGVLTIVGHGDPQIILALSFNIGDIWIFFSMLLFGLYTVCLRWRPNDLHPLSFLAATAIIGTLAMLPLYFWSLAAGYHVNWNANAIVGVLYLGSFPTAIAYIFWNNAVTRVGPNKTGMFTNLIPLFTAVLAIVFLDETLHFFHVAGILMIVGGIWLVNRRRA